MKKIVLAALMVVAGAASASAADLPVKAPPPPPPPPCIWCGFYIGLNGGWVGNTVSSDRNLAVATFENGVPVTLFGPFWNNDNTNGGFGGGQIGFNWVFPGGYGGGPTVNGGWLVGVEADIQGASLRRTSPTLFFLDLDEDTTTVTSDSRLNWFGTARGRFGYAWDSVLVYGTGGVAFGGVKNNLLLTFHDDFEECFQCFGSTLTSNNSNRWGWVVGAGMEWMFAPNWSFKFEYQYIDLGSATNAAAVSLITDNSLEGFETEGAVAARRLNNRFDTVRIGVNYHFGGALLGGYGGYGRY